MRLKGLFSDFVGSNAASGWVLIACTIVSMILANSFWGPAYVGFWEIQIFSHPLKFWINEGLMAVFFLHVGLELEREVYAGELSTRRKAMLPLLGALGGMLVPAAIYLLFNHGTGYSSGFGIPMATDIAFSLAVLALLGPKVPVSLKIFLTALAVIDDLGAILVIALFYSGDLSLMNVGISAAIFAVMLLLNRLRMHIIWIYLVLGAVMWFFMLNSGIHPTISGVLLAFAIPFGTGSRTSPSYGLEHKLSKPVTFVIMPLFALANTAILISADSVNIISSHSLGIILGLVAGKPLGIFAFAMAGVAIGLCTFPKTITRMQLFATGALGGIGFTMSIFISLLAFSDHSVIEGSKVAVICGSVLSGLFGYAGLKFALRKSG